MQRNYLTITILIICLAEQMTMIQKAAALKISNYSTLLPGFRFCHFEGHKYKIGEKFHPKALFSGEVYEMLCTTCTCNPTTQVQCEKEICPTLTCDNPIRLKGECCDRCPGENLSGVELEGVAPQPLDCILDGVIYEHGSRFHPPSDNLSNHTDLADVYCTVCSCDNGTISFTDVSSSCPPIMACEESQAFHVEGSCCKVCPEVNLSRGECKDELGNLRSSNETWNYYSSVYQKRLTCLNCSCEGSTYTCKRNPCPPVPPCTEEDEEEELVICCPKCSNGIIGTPPQSTEQPETEQPTLDDCTDVYGYRVFLCNPTSMAIEDVKNKSVVNYVWLGSGVKQAFRYTSDEFNKLSCSHPNNYRGGTIERRVNGLQTRQSKREKILNCKKNCAQMVVNMLRPVPLEKQQC